MSSLPLLAIDLSFRSPGVVLSFRGVTKFWAVSQHKRLGALNGIASPDGKQQIWRHPYMHEESDARIVRVVDELVQWVSDQVGPSVNAISVMIEGYASYDSPSTPCLMETRGALKYALRKRFTISSWKDVAPSTAKKRLTGNGHAKKRKMMDTYTEKYGDFLFDTLGCKDKPFEDLVDGFSVYLCSQPPNKRQKR